jgi:hypothetical protein
MPLIKKKVAFKKPAVTMKKPFKKGVLAKKPVAVLPKKAAVVQKKPRYIVSFYTAENVSVQDGGTYETWDQMIDGLRNYEDRNGVVKLEIVYKIPGTVPAWEMEAYLARKAAT